MKFSVLAFIGLSISLLTTSAMAANTIPKEMQADAEYMMRKVVEDIHQYKVRTTVTDVTRDKGIKVVGYALKFIPARKLKKSGETFSCARVSLKTNIRSGKSARKQIKRTDEICTGNKSGRVRYVANVH
ncbi:MAG: hypothetical protein JKX94_07180 [Sneathiella sp.]|nr:hypothetical protein [Sneathiella sp.]